MFSLSAVNDREHAPSNRGSDSAVSVPSRLMRSRRFLPYFITQFLGAFNDNAFRFALLMLVTYRLADQTAMGPESLAALSAGLFILPFFLFSAFAGQFADRYSKRAVIILLKGTECVLMGLAAVAFFLAEIRFLLALVFLMGAQSAFFGPLKYGILPQLLGRKELLSANAWTQGGTFFAILLGTLFGSALAAFETATFWISLLVIGAAGAGLLASLWIPRTPAAAPDLSIDWNGIRQTWRVFTFAFADRFVFLCMIGISWFWFVGASLLSQFPVLARQVLHASEGVASLLLVLMSTGVAVGAFLCAKLLRGRPDPRYVPFATLALSLFLFALIYTAALVPSSSDLYSLDQFLDMGEGRMVLVWVFLLALAGGFYTTPLYTLIQVLAGERRRARTIAAANLLNSGFMVLSAVLFILGYGWGYSLLGLLFLIAVVNVPFAGLLFVGAAMARERFREIDDGDAGASEEGA